MNSDSKAAAARYLREALAEGIDRPSQYSPCAFLLLNSGTVGGMTPSLVPLYPGLYLLGGAKTAGKTVTALGLTLSQVPLTETGMPAATASMTYRQFEGAFDDVEADRDPDVQAAMAMIYGKGGLLTRARYRPTVEPRSALLGSDLGLVKTGSAAGESIVAPGRSLFEGAFEWFRDILDTMTPMMTTGGFGCIDSLTHVIPIFGSYVMSQLTPPGADHNSRYAVQDVTLEGGVNRSSMYGVLALNALCAERKIALIGTVNSELFPRLGIFEGVTEGLVTLEATYSFSIRDRSTRETRLCSLLPEISGVTLAMLGYSAPSRNAVLEINHI